MNNTRLPGHVETLAAQLQKLGWYFRPRWEDNDETKPIIGVRLTNCAKIFENAQTIQIFNTATVTLQFGFLQEQSVSLTGEDGALFIEWLKATHPDLAAPVLAAVPIGDRTPGASNTGLNMAKGRLAEYLADTWPEVFGRGGSATKPGADFYDEVLKLLRIPKDPETDAHAMCARLILAAENMAHDMYADCNATLRGAARAQAPEVVAEFEMDAYGRAMAAETARAYARTLRNRLPKGSQPPDAEFPEAIELESIPIVAKIRALNGTPAPNPLASRGIPPASDTLATTPKKIRLGAMVAIIDPTHAKFRQMGVIQATLPPDSIWVMVSGATAAEEFRPEQLMSPS